MCSNRHSNLPHEELGAFSASQAKRKASAGEDGVLDFVKQGGRRKSADRNKLKIGTQSEALDRTNTYANADQSIAFQSANFGGNFDDSFAAAGNPYMQQQQQQQQSSTTPQQQNNPHAINGGASNANAGQCFTHII